MKAILAFALLGRSRAACYSLVLGCVCFAAIQARAQSILVERGESAILLASGPAFVNGTVGGQVLFSGSIEGRADLFTSVAFAKSKVAATLGVNVFTDRSENGLTGLAGGFLLADGIGLAPFVGVTGEFRHHLRRGTLLLTPGGSLSIAFARPAADDAISIYSFALELPLWIRISEHTRFLVGAELGLATRPPSADESTLRGVALMVGWMYGTTKRTGTRPR